MSEQQSDIDAEAADALISNYVIHVKFVAGLDAVCRSMKNKKQKNKQADVKTEAKTSGTEHGVLMLM